MPWLLETKLRPWEGVIAHDPIMNFMPDALLGRSSQILQRTRLMANSIRELWLTRREQQPRYVMCTPSARDRLRMRVCRARASRALTSVVHSFCECIERRHFRVCGEPVGLEDRVFGVVRGCAECAGARGSARLHASKIFRSASVTLTFFAL